MAKRADRSNSFVLQKQPGDSSRQPVEIYHLSHDLRGPLNSILGFTELLLEGIEGPLNETQEADLTAINQSAHNLLHLINSVVDLSKLEAGRLKMTFEAVALEGVIENVLASDLVRDQPDRLEVTAKVPAGIPSVRGDGERIEQMILSFVRFGLKSGKQNRAAITAESDEDTVTVRVDMDGVMVPADELPELFELTVKVDPGGRSELGRGGLSLPLTQQLAEEQHGRVWAESRTGGGTVFYLILPVYQE